MRLIDVEHNVWIRIVGFEDGSRLREKMLRYGLFPGDRARVTRTAPLDGPLLVEVNERSIALGRGIAEKILVEQA